MKRKWPLYYWKHLNLKPLGMDKRINSNPKLDTENFEHKTLENISTV